MVVEEQEVEEEEVEFPGPTGHGLRFLVALMVLTAAVVVVRYLK